MTARFAAAALWLAVPVGAAERCPSEQGDKHPKLRPLFAAAQGLQEKAAKGARFSELVAESLKLQKLLELHQADVQEAGCGLEGKAMKDFEACLPAVQWSCEGVPFDLWECCGDFGCAPDGIRLNWLTDKERLAKLEQLSLLSGHYADRALRMLEAAATDLENAACHCEPGDEAGRRAATNLNERLGKTGKGDPRAERAARAYQRLLRRLAKGTPTEECQLPGY